MGYEIIKLEDNVYKIEEDFVRCFLIIGTQRALLIDTGIGSDDLKTKISSITDLPITLVNTHNDRDHIGANNQFLLSYMHELDIKKADILLEGKCKFISVNEGYIFDLGNCKLEVIHIPGHTPGSIALLNRESKSLFSGDSVQSGDIFMFGDGRNMESYLGSMRKLNEMKTLFNKVYPSHSEIPVSPEIIQQLIVGAEKYLNNELSGEIEEVHGRKINKCNIGCAYFLTPAE